MVPQIQKVTDRIFLLIWEIFCPFIHNHVYASWRHEIWSETDRFFWHFGLFFALWYPKSPKIKILKKWRKCLGVLSIYTCVPQMNDIWFLKYGAWQRSFFVILDHFLPFYPPNNPKNQTFENTKKPLEISFHAGVP